MITLSLPFPPSTNRYWRSVPLPGRKGVKVCISKAGREYSEEVARIVASSGIEQQTGELFARYDLYPPDKRSRDLDNFDSKAVNDALTKSGVLVDDSQIRGKVSYFHDDQVIQGGKIIVQLARLEMVQEIYKIAAII